MSKFRWDAHFNIFNRAFDISVRWTFRRHSVSGVFFFFVASLPLSIKWLSFCDFQRTWPMKELWNLLLTRLLRRQEHGTMRILSKSTPHGNPPQFLDHDIHEILHDIHDNHGCRRRFGFTGTEGLPWPYSWSQSFVGAVPMETRWPK